MRRAIRVAPLVTMTLAALAAGQAWSTDGRLTIEVLQADANKPNKDDPTNSEQDFFVQYAIDLGGPSFAEKISDRDHPIWSKNNTKFKMVPNMNQRFFDLYFELWDDDGCFLCTNPPDDFDISPQSGPPPKPFSTYDPTWQNGGFPHVQYDVCTGEMYVKSVLGSSPIPIGSNAVTLNGYGTTSGTMDNWAWLQFRVIREPDNWLPEDIAVKSVSMVQAVYDPTRAVVLKPTSMKVEVVSTYPLTLHAPLYGEMTDGYTTVSDLRPVVQIDPGYNVYFLFDGAGSPPFLPWKPITANSGTLSGWARIDYTETVSPNAPIQLMDCANINNIGQATSLPLSRTQDVKVVYRRFDYEEDQDFITKQLAQDLFDQEETFRRATWPLASLTGSLDFTPLHLDHGALFPFVEPFASMIGAHKMAFIAGIDRLVLSVRNDWFGENAFRHFPLGDPIGLSLGPFFPRAVIAEEGYYGVAVHELGHTFRQSQHKCSNGGLGETLMNMGCLDEYNHRPPDTNPYEARGFDVEGLVYPHGMHVDPAWGFPGLDCPLDTPVQRDICAPNIMDANPAADFVHHTTFLNWIDGGTFDDLFTRLHAGTDPLLLQVSGSIVLPMGFGDGVAPPPIVGQLDPFNYVAFGTQDLPPAPLSQTGEAFSGTGAFRVRLVTPMGVRDYRFNTRFLPTSSTPEERGFFSLSLPYDPSTLAVELIAPFDLLHVCQSQFCPGNEIPIASMPRTPLPPGVSNLRAGRDVAPPTLPLEPPIIGPGHEAVLQWDAADPDSPETRAAIVIWRQDAGGPPGDPEPMGIDVAGGVLRIPHADLADSPGTYSGKVLVTDGVNTTELGAGPLFTICAASNGGVETCDGMDNDCDGVVDNAMAPASPIVRMAGAPPQIQWTPIATAQSYDVVYGSLSGLGASDGNFTAAILGCVADNTGSTAADFALAPPAGTGYFFLVRSTNCGGPGTYDGGGPAQVGSRDAEVAAAPGACPP